MKEKTYKANDIVYFRTAAASEGKLVKGTVYYSYKRSGIYCTGIRWEKTYYAIQWENSPYPTDWLTDNIVSLTEAKKIIKERKERIERYKESDAYKNAPWRKVLEASKKV